MIQQFLVKILLAPFALLYGIGISLRDFFYRKELLKGVEFNVPVIAVGNLTVGGAGKSPHIEYLIRLLNDYIEVATLSRGYKRKTKGFLEVQSNMTAETAGDEPLQFKRKFPEIVVTVSESRTFGIPEIVKRHPRNQVVLLDDAFQHRSVKPGLNILLTEYRYPFTQDFLLPVGRLREWRSAYQRADIIVVSKCPRQLGTTERDALLQEIRPFPYQKVYFSTFSYQNPYYLFNPAQQVQLGPEFDVLLISAIARTEYLTEYLEEQVKEVFSLEYEDHHFFTNFDISHLKRTFDALENPWKIILTTEKDGMRLELHRNFLLEHRLPVFVLPVEVEFLFGDGLKFDQQIREYLLSFRS